MGFETAPSLFFLLFTQVKAMPKKEAADINRSKVIREFKDDNPDAKPKRISSFLKDKYGVSVSPQYVSSILSNAKRKGGKIGKRGRPRKPSESVGSNELFLVKQLIEQVGSIDAARQAIQTYDELMT